MNVCKIKIIPKKKKIRKKEGLEGWREINRDRKGEKEGRMEGEENGKMEMEERKQEAYKHIKQRLTDAQLL